MNVAASIRPVSRAAWTGAAASAGSKPPTPQAGALHCELWAADPSSAAVPADRPGHLMLVSLSDGLLIREAGGDRTVNALRPGFVSLVPQGHPVRWIWATPVRFVLLSLDALFLQQVAREDCGARVSGLVLRPVERDAGSLGDVEPGVSRLTAEQGPLDLVQQDRRSLHAAA